MTVSDQFTEYASSLVSRLRAHFVRAELASAADTVSKKIRDGLTRKIPNFLIVGEREAQDGTVTLRRYGVKQQTTLPFDRFEAAVREAIADRRLALEVG